MPFDRRRFLKTMTAAGLAIPAGHWLFEQLEAYAADRLAYADVRGPGILSFSRSVCRDCANHCSLALSRIDELPVGVRGTAWHPASRGALCPAGLSQMQALFDRDRLTTPLIREAPGETGRAESVDRALEIVAERIRKLVSEGRGDRLAVVDGRTPSLGTLLTRSWTHSIAGARYVPLRIESAMHRLAAPMLGGARGSRLAFDVERAGPLLLVGAEILEVDGSPVRQMWAHGERRESRRLGNAPTIYVGPRQSPTAAKSDLWIACQPGEERDVVLALAEALFSGHRQWNAVLAEYARWVPEARDPLELARRYSPEKVSEELGLRRGELQNVLKAFADFGQLVCVPGPGVLRRANGGADARAVLALNFWTGGFAEEGGLFLQRDPLIDVSTRLGLETGAEDDAGTLGDILQPLFEIKRSPVDVLICVEANLVHELPGRDQIARALSHVPFMVSLATHEDETAQLSRVTLPVLLSLESWDLPAPAWGAPELAVQVQRPALVPVVASRSVEDIILALGRGGAGGPGHRTPATSGEELVAAAVREIVAVGRGKLVSADGEHPLAGLAGETARAALLSGEAVWLDERASATGDRTTPGEFPALVPLVDLAPGQVWLVPFDGLAIQGGRVLNRPMMMEMSGLLHGLAWEPWIEIHPEDARSLGIHSGDAVRIRGPRAEIVCRSVVTHSIVPGVAAASIGFGHQTLGHVARGHGQSLLTLPNAAIDAELGAAIWGPIPVFLQKVGGMESHA